MASPVAPPETTPAGTHPGLVVGGTVVVVAIVSFLIFSVGDDEADQGVATGPAAKLAEPASDGACGFGAPDARYGVAVDATPDPPRPEGTTLRLTVRRDDRVITGAKVCVLANMPSMQHPGLTTVAQEGLDGRYETVLKFGMGGSWEAAVIIAEPGQPVVSVTVPIEVAEVTFD